METRLDRDRGKGKGNTREREKKREREPRPEKVRRNIEKRREKRKKGREKDPIRYSIDGCSDGPALRYFGCGEGDARVEIREGNIFLMEMGVIKVVRVLSSDDG